MDRFEKNAFRVHGLPVDAPLDALLATPDGERLRDPAARARERLFAPGDDARGRAVAEHARLVGKEATDASEWRAALDAWKAQEPALREWLAGLGEETSVLQDLEADLLEINVKLGAKALEAGNVARAKVHASLLERLPESARADALERLVTPAAEPIVTQASEIRAVLEALELDEGATNEALASARQAIDDGARRADDLAARAERVKAVDATAAQAPCDQVALAYLQLGISNWRFEEQRALTSRWFEHAAQLATTETLKKKIANEQLSVRTAETFKDVWEARDKGKVEKARRLLLKLRPKLPPELRPRADEVLAEPRRLLGPIGSAPGLFTVNGMGVRLYGRRSQGPDGTYVATTCFCFFFIPLIPITAYLVRDAGTGWSFFGKVPLSTFARTVQRLFLAAIVLVPLTFWAVDAYEHSPWVRETQALSRAESALRAGGTEVALGTVRPLLRSASGDRRARAIEIGSTALLRALEKVDGARAAKDFVAGAGHLALEIQDEALYRDEVVRALTTCCEKTGSPELIEWGRLATKTFHAASLDLARALAEKSDEPRLLAATVEWHRADGVACPPEPVAKLGRVLLLSKRSGKPHATWDQDALVYLAVAPDADARPVLLARVEAFWKATADGKPLRPYLEKGPSVLVPLFDADETQDLRRRAAKLEKIADPGTLEEPQATWHRLGIARRLAWAYSELNERDPVHEPVERARKWAIVAAELSPDDAVACARAMRFLLEAGETARVIALGEKLGERATPETTTLLGVALARSGRNEDAERTLAPYVDENLERYAQLYVTYETAVKDLERRLLDSLRNGTGDQSFIRRLNALPHDRANAEVMKWLGEQIEHDGRLQSLGKQLRDLGGVHAAAFELALVEIALARDMKPGFARESRFKHAEKIFLALRKVAGDDPSQELQLGQVYFWLGRRAEGQEIFDRLERAGDARILVNMGEIYRLLDERDNARRVLEAAYEHLPPGPERENAACIRGLEPKDEDDGIAWLEKAGSSDFVQIALAQAKGNKLLAAGDVQAAVPHLRRAAEFFSRSKDNSTALHNASTAVMSIYYATGAVSDLQEALRLAKEAVSRSKDNAIELRNYLHLLEAVAWQALAGSVVKNDVLRERPGLDWLAFVKPRLAREERTRRIAQQPELRRALDLARRLTVISPESEDGYEFQAQFATRTDDAATLRKLREDLEAANLVRAESVKASLEYQGGKRDPAARAAFEKHLAAYAKRLEAIRRTNHAPTIALALVHQSTSLVAARWSAPELSDLDRAVALADEARALVDTGPTRDAVAGARLERASAALAKTDERYAKWVAASPDGYASCLLWLYQDKHSDARERIRALEDVKVAAKAIAAEARDPGGWPGVAEIVILELAGHEAAADAKKAVLARGVALERARIDLLLAPQSTSCLVYALVAARAFEDAAVEKRLVAQARERKLIPLYVGD